MRSTFSAFAETSVGVTQERQVGRLRDAPRLIDEIIQAQQTDIRNTMTCGQGATG